MSAARDRRTTPAAVLDTGSLDAGAALLLVRNALGRLEDGQLLEVESRRPDVATELFAWCRLNDVEVVSRPDEGQPGGYLLRRGHAAYDGTPDWGLRLPPAS